MAETWKDIPRYKGLYQASSGGRIRSLDRKVLSKDNIERSIKGVLLTPVLDNGQYLVVSLWKHGKGTKFSVHQLIAMAFLNHTPDRKKVVVDHIDNDKLNNNSDNLRLISQRENTNRKHLKHSSKYTGVSWHKTKKKYEANIRIDGKLRYLGSFTNEIEAHRAYEKRLNKLNKTNMVTKKERKTIALPKEVYDMVKKEADKLHRSPSNYLIWIFYNVIDGNNNPKK